MYMIKRFKQKMNVFYSNQVGAKKILWYKSFDINVIKFMYKY